MGLILGWVLAWGSKSRVAGMVGLLGGNSGFEAGIGVDSDVLMRGRLAGNAAMFLVVTSLYRYNMDEVSVQPTGNYCCVAGEHCMRPHGRCLTTTHPRKKNLGYLLWEGSIRSHKYSRLYLSSLKKVFCVYSTSNTIEVVAIKNQMSIVWTIVPQEI